MECIILRSEITVNFCSFVLEGNSHWKVIAKRTHGIRLGNYSIYKDMELQYSLKQTSIPKQLLEKVPLLGFIYRNPYYFCKGAKYCGDVKIRLFPTRYQFSFDGNSYLVSIHSGTTHSLLINNRQVAVYNRYGEGSYKVLFDLELHDRPDLLILFAAFVEMYATIDTAVAANPEGYKMINDKHPERAVWVPKADNIDEP